MLSIAPTTLQPLSTLISVPDVGHGNPAAAQSVQLLLQRERDRFRTVVLQILHVSAIPQRLVHQVLTRHDQARNGYNGSLGKVRSGFLGRISGILNAVELLPTLVTQNFSIGVFVQEHQLYGLPRNLLKRLFPQGVFLIIPDVFPKKNAVELMHNRGVCPVVWNQAAFQMLSDRGLTPILAEPTIPVAHVPESLDLNDTKPIVVLKSSGSGLPAQLYEKLRFFLETQGVCFDTYLPRQVASNCKSSTACSHASKGSAGTDFYPNMLSQPPRIIIGFPSEVVQVIAWMKSKGWSGEFVALPPRGAHEQGNLKWAMEHKLCAGILTVDSNPHDTTEPAIPFIGLNRLVDLFRQPPSTITYTASNMGLGTTSFAQAIQERLTSSIAT